MTKPHAVSNTMKPKRAVTGEELTVQAANNQYAKSTIGKYYRFKRSNINRISV